MARWDWEKIRLQYLESDFKEVKSFFQHFYGTFNSTIKHKTIGWSADKKLSLKKSRMKAVEIIEAKTAISIEESLSKVLFLVSQIIDMDLLRHQLRPGELYALWKILRTEAGLPCSYNYGATKRPPIYDFQDFTNYEKVLAKLSKT